MTEAKQALLPVTQEDNAVTVALTEWLISRDIFFEDGPPENERVMHEFGAFADELIARHRQSQSHPGDVGMREAVATSITDALEFGEHGMTVNVEKATDLILAALTPSALSGNAGEGE